MSKYFKTKEAFDKWIVDFRKSYMGKQNADLFSQLMALGPEQEDYVKGLIADGYTDLDNLVEDGHAYEIGGYKNNGWLYRDEVSYFANIPEERIKDR